MGNTQLRQTHIKIEAITNMAPPTSQNKYEIL